jgi:hypothetical protein
MKLCIIEFMGTKTPCYGGWGAEPVDGIHIGLYRNPNEIPEYFLVHQ